MLRIRTLSQLANAAIRTSGVTKRSLASHVGSNRLQSTAAAAAAEPFLSGSSSVYVEEMYAAWLEDPKSVHKVSSELKAHWYFASMWNYVSS